MPRMLVSEADRILASVPEHFVFRCCDGSDFWNLRDLSRGVSNMKGDVFSFHVKGQKNDFANWVADVIGDHALARALWETRNPSTTLRRLAERVAYLESRRN